MAMEAGVCPDISAVPAMSPRISFSQDFIHTEPIPVEQRPYSRSTLSSSFDFDFDLCIREGPHQQPSSADEIFSHGKILPLQMNPKSHGPSPPPAPPKSKPHPSASEIRPQRKQGSNSKSFWHFKRSTSCGSGYTPTLCPLPLLSRSNSTGCTPNMKQKQASHLTNNASASKNSQTAYHRPPLKKHLHGYGLQVSPILNLHSRSLFGLAALFSSPKDTPNKK